MTVGVAADVGCEVRVTLSPDSRQVRVCLPTAFDGVPVRILDAPAPGAGKGGNDVRPSR